MADVRAFRSGNWSDVTATSPWWNGTAIFAPAAGDNVYAATWTITVDTSVNLGANSFVTNGSATIRTWKDGATVALNVGGTYVLNNGVTLTSNISALNGNISAAAVQLASTNSAAIVGNMIAGTSNGVPSFGIITNYGTGTLTITGNINGATSIINHNVGVWNNASGIINITGNVTGNSGGAASGAFNNASGTINITGNVTGGITAVGVGATNNALGTMTITGNVLANVASGANNISTGAFTIIGDITATNGVNGFTSSSTSATNRLSGSFINSANGTAAIYATKYILYSTPLLAKTRYALNGISTYVDMFTSDNTSGITGVATTDVRSGVSYGGGLVGTCAVPNAGTVSFGVAVDNTTGTATLTAANLRAALGLASANLDSQLAVLSNLDTTVSSRLSPSGTLATVTTLTNAPTVPTPTQIASQVRTELATELGRIDTTISSRLAPSGTLATVTTLTNAPASVTPAQIRAEMDSNSTKLANLDATVSSRLASSVSTNITAIKAKTDLLNTDRLAQCATTSIVGSLIAQSNS